MEHTHEAHSVTPMQYTLTGAAAALLGGVLGGGAHYLATTRQMAGRNVISFDKGVRGGHVPSRASVAVLGRRSPSRPTHPQRRASMPEPGCAPSQSRYAANTFGVYEVINQCCATVDTNSSVCDLCRPRLWERACCCVGRLPPVALCSGAPWECRQSLRPRSRASTTRWSFSVSRGYVLAGGLVWRGLS